MQKCSADISVLYLKDIEQRKKPIPSDVVDEKELLLKYQKKLWSGI